jgi:hypothetical protein
VILISVDSEQVRCQYDIFIQALTNNNLWRQNRNVASTLASWFLVWKLMTSMRVCTDTAGLPLCGQACSLTYRCFCERCTGREDAVFKRANLVLNRG